MLIVVFGPFQLAGQPHRLFDTPNE
jgi:hypothetical protein